MKSILLVEDCPEASMLVRRALEPDVFVQIAPSIRQASRLIEREVFDLIVLDISLPDGEGYRLCSMLQMDDSLRKIPIIFLTARNTVADRIMGYSLGADDFMSKPLEPREFKARVEARLRRKDSEVQQSDIAKIEGLEVNKTTHKVRALIDECWEDVSLTSIELRVLLFLMMAPNQVHSRDVMLDSIWGEHVHVFSRSVDTHISKLRKKLGATAECIESIHGTGYRMNVEDKKLARMTLGRLN